MKKQKDITGLTIHDLTAKNFSHRIPGIGDVWVWACVCGKETERRPALVIGGHTKSCGCRRVTRVRNPDPIPCVMCGKNSNRQTKTGSFATTCKPCYNSRKNHTNKRSDHLYYRAKDRANKQGIPFTISKQDVVIPEFCPILGVKLFSGSMKERNNSPSLDRIIPELGYVLGNIAVISHLANRIKNTGTAEEHRKIADWMESHLSQVSEAARA